ncbi:MAG: hypothetical protein CBC35_00835 [Planctomycetes bacterium TMED75]|nr:MAG: hypothetical protein CBC35_00835 [Planctomycetes bacterium TMED75]
MRSEGVLVTGRLGILPSAAGSGLEFDSGRSPSEPAQALLRIWGAKGSETPSTPAFFLGPSAATPDWILPDIISGSGPIRIIPLVRIDPAHFNCTFGSTLPTPPSEPPFHES